MFMCVYTYTLTYTHDQAYRCILTRKSIMNSSTGIMNSLDFTKDLIAQNNLNSCTARHQEIARLNAVKTKQTDEFNGSDYSGMHMPNVSSQLVLSINYEV